MTRLVLVRHGRPAASWTEDADPGLDDVGRAQAGDMADHLAPSGPLHLVSSPLRRTRETAAPLEAAWGVPAVVDGGVGEIPSPDLGVTERGAWLVEVMRGRWRDLPDELLAWRERVLATLTSVTVDAVVVTHFVAVNVAVGAATGDDRLVCFHPDHCSRTILDVTPSGLVLVERGREASTVVR